MKSFKHYLMESVRTYRYKIKVAGSPDRNWVDLFKANLQKFDPVKIGDAKTTPVQKDPYGFPGLKNQSVTMIDVEFKYPATEPMIKQLARLLNYDENLVRMIQADYDESVNAEAEQYANQASHTPVLNHEELEDAGKQASKDYADQYLSKIKKESEKDKIDMPYAAPKTAPAVDSRAKPGNEKSPLTSVKVQPKPATGGSTGFNYR
jgi:hypothetical protein